MKMVPHFIIKPNIVLKFISMMLNERKYSKYIVTKLLNYVMKQLLLSLFFPSIFYSARSTAYLYLIMTINWIFEIISFYTQTPSSSSLVLFDVLNALQGVVIFIIFLCLPRPKRIITRWWKSQGSLDCNTTEMEVLNNRNHIKN